MKRTRLFLLALVTVTLAACSPTIQGYMGGLPPEIRLAILVGATIIVARLFEILAAKLPPQLDPRQYTTQVAAALAGVVVLAAEALLRTIDPAYDPIVETLLHLLVIVLGGLGGLFALKQYKVPGFRE